MPRFRFAVVGDNCVDRFHPPVSQSLIGGNAVNVAAQLALLGHQAHYFGAVGPDADGDHVRALLGENGVEAEHLEVREGRTAYTDIDVLPSGERVFRFEDFGVCQEYIADDAAFAVLKTMDHVHIGWLSDGGALRRRLAGAGVSVSQDVSVNNEPVHLGIEGLTIAFGSGGEATEPAQALMGRFLDGGVRCAVVTRGAAGSMARQGNILAQTGIRSVDVVDTTGAGDSFIAGFLGAFLGQQSLQVCLEAGRDCAARTCAHVGGFPQHPRTLESLPGSF